MGYVASARMYQGKRILGVIPARGGSKGIPMKNIRLLDGKPLLVYSIEQAKGSRLLDHFVVSSDDNEILRIATKWGASIVKRPEELAQDTSATPPVLIHALDKGSQNCADFDFVVTIQPTSPLRTQSLIDDAIVTCIDKGYDSVMSVHEDRHPFGVLREDGAFVFLDPARRRQDRKPLFRENGAVYVTSSSILRDRCAVFGDRLGVLISDEIESLDIDTVADFQLAEYFLKHKQ